MANRKHYAVTVNVNGQKEKVRLWDYFRKNRRDFSSLSGKQDSEIRTIGLKNGLKKQGWKVEEFAEEVLIVRS